MGAVDIYRAHNGAWVPLRGSTTTPPPATGARQVIGMSVPTGGNSFSGSVNQVEEEARLAEIFGWPNGGPPYQRIYYQTDMPPANGWIARLAGQGRHAWASIKPGSGGVAGDRTGASDARFTAWARYLATLWPTNVWWSYDHEVDRNTNSGAANATSPGWAAYQSDFRQAHARMVGVMRDADPLHDLEHVTFVGIVTGFACRKQSNRDIGQCWDPSMDVFAADGYDSWLLNNGGADTPQKQFWTSGSLSTGQREHYEFGINPLDWYSKYHPTWAVPAHITANLARFPTRMATGETGTQFVMQPNAGRTLWVPTDDPDDDNAYQPSWIRQLGADLRDRMPRRELVCYWHSSTDAIGAATGNPNYFAGPSALRWGAEFAASKRAFRSLVQMPQHQGPVTPWTPAGLA